MSRRLISNGKSAGYLLAGVIVCALLMAAGVNGLFNHVTSTTGYQVNGAAGSSGQALCSDGTNFDTACTPAGTGITALTGPVTASGSGSVASTITATGVTAGSYVLPAFTVNAAGQITTAASAGIRKNCMSVSCAGGSTYASGTTYTNSLSVPVFEEVGMTTSAGSCTGADSQITYTVAGSAQGGNGVWNQCNGVAHVSFIVPPGATFSSTVLYIDGGASPSLSSWFETTL